MLIAQNPCYLSHNYEKNEIRCLDYESYNIYTYIIYEINDEVALMVCVLFLIDFKKDGRSQFLTAGGFVVCI